MSSAVEVTAGVGSSGVERSRGEAAAGSRTEASSGASRPGGERWVVEWHPANGGAIRRLSLSHRVVLGWILALALASSAVAAGGISAGLERLRGHDKMAAARHENSGLRARRTALSSDLVEPSGLSGAFEDGVRHRRCNLCSAER